jgi:hypothetical protein
VGRVCGARSAVTVRYYPAGAESCSVLSGSVVATGRVSVLKSFNIVTRCVNRKSGLAYLVENWKVNKQDIKCRMVYAKTEKW